MDIAADASPIVIKAEPLTQEAYAAFGVVIEDKLPGMESANQNTGRVKRDCCPLINLRSHDVPPTLSMFRCFPTKLSPFPVRLLEKHPFSTQVFMPISVVSRYLVIVALEDPATKMPDMKTLRAFIARDGQAISYAPGIWHQPMATLDTEVSFSVFLFADGSDDDCIIVDTPEAVVEYPVAE